MIQPAPKQQGLAIITVMLMIALMMTLLGFLIEKQHILIRRMANQNAIENGYNVAQGVETWAAKVLTLDQNRLKDHWLEDWAKLGQEVKQKTSEENQSFSLKSSLSKKEEERVVIDLGLGELDIKIVDLQGRYNLNNLRVKQPPTRKNEQKRIFINLLGLLGINEFDEQERLYGALLDWLDGNDLKSPNGYESNDYQIKKVPYYAADQKLISLGELRFVEGFTQQIINKLEPHVVVLPVENARININTTSEQVLASLNSGPIADISSVSAFLSLRNEELFAGFDPANITDAETAINGVSSINRGPVSDMMQVKSDYFQIEATVKLGEFQFQMKTRLLRRLSDKGNTVQVLSRQYSML